VFVDRTVRTDPARNALFQAVQQVKLARAESLAVDALIGTLRPRSFDPASSLAATAALVWLGPEARSAVPELVRTLGDARVPTALQCEAAHLLGVLGGDDPATVPVLIDALSRREPAGTRVGTYISDGGVVAEDAAIALGRLGPKARAAVPRLIDALGSEIRNVRVAAMALGDIAEEEPRTITALERLKVSDADADPSVQHLASRAIERIRARSAPKTGTIAVQHRR
jgi:HEAT repeat protein